jgi:hypothetical protein
VADASVAVSWSVASQSSALRDRLLDDVGLGGIIIVPPLWPYQVAYLELAIRRQLPLASRDKDLNRAAHRCGVQILV